MNEMSPKFAGRTPIKEMVDKFANNGVDIYKISLGVEEFIKDSKIEELKKMRDEVSSLIHKLGEEKMTPAFRRALLTNFSSIVAGATLNVFVPGTYFLIPPIIAMAVGTYDINKKIEEMTPQDPESLETI